METKLYHQREVMAITGLPASTLRYWEKQFAQINPRKDGHGNRYYTQEDINIFKQIRYIRDELMITRIDAIKKELNHGERQADIRQQATDVLLHLRNQLVQIKDLIG